MRHKALVSAISAAALLVLAPDVSGQTLKIERYSSVASFKARLAGFPVKTVNFDTIATSGSANVAFPAGRYKTNFGMIITGEGGQYASRDFGSPGDFVPASLPNMYAPGPIDMSGTSGAAGGNETTVTFFAGAAKIRAAGFGCYFIDADWPGDGPSSMQIYNSQGTKLADSGTVVTADAKRVFVGFVAVNAATNLPVAAISRVHIVNGSGWLGNDWNEGVALDNFMAGTATYSATGKVRERSGAAVPGVKITLTGVGFTRTATTNGLGAYSFANLPDGTYTLVPTKSGRSFTPIKRTVTVTGHNVAVLTFVAN